VGGLFIQGLTAAGGGLTLPIVGHLETWRAVFVLAAAPGVPLMALLLAVKEPVRRGATPVLDAGRPAAFWSYMRRRWFVFSGVFLAFACSNVAGYGAMTWAPVVLMRVNQVPAGEVGMMLGAAMILVNGSAPFVGGVLADAGARRFALDGRLRVVLILLPVAMAGLALFAVTGSPVAIVAACVGASAPAAATNAICYTVLYDVTPNQLRGQVIAAYLLVGTMLSVGLSPTLIALVTDYVFHDDNMVQYSILVVGAGGFLVSLACVLAIMRPYRALRASVLG